MEMKWTPVEEKQPQPGEYVLVSFSNYTLPDIGRYEVDKEGGAFYPGDEEQPYKSFDLIVNAWMPLPECYREE